MSRPQRPPFPVGLTIATLIALGILLGLGAWQVQRLHWKEGLLAHLAALQHATAQPIDPVLARLAQGQDIDYTRVSLDCPALQQGAYVRLYGLLGGAAGWRIVGACPLSGAPYGTVLVDRGFMPADASGGATPAPGPALTQPVVGVLRHGDPKTFVTPADELGQRQFFFRDVPAMATLLGASRPAPIFLMLESPAAPAGGPVPAALPADIPNNHLQYAVTWFGLAGALLCVYLASLWRRLRSH